MITPFSLLSNKIDSLFYYYTYLTSRVFNVIRLGPDDALYSLSVFYRCGAEVAREAHNPEVIGSNPIAGIIIFRIGASGT